MTGPPIPRILYDKTASPLSKISDRLVVDAIRRASLTITGKPTIAKYPPNYFSSAEEQSSSSSEDEKKKRPIKESIK